jgi:opacity protein-like surface antigen
MGGQISPFAGGGLGLTISRTKLDFAEATLFGLNTDGSSSESDTDLSFHFVVGVDIPIAPDVKLTFEAKHALDGVDVTWLTGAVCFRLQ